MVTDDDRFSFAEGLIQRAGALALGHFRNLGRLTVTAKGPQDVVSEADVETERLIRARIAGAFPQDAFLGEETGISALTEDQGIWVVDPIDGTQPFLSGMDSWCVSIAFVRGRQVQFGLVFAPVRGEMFTGGLGRPALLNGQPLRRHPGRSLRDGVVGTGYNTRLDISAFLGLMEGLLRAGGMFYRNGSGALMLCDVAAGRLIGYVEAHINAWDCLGAVAVLQSAGLKVNDFLAGDGLTRGNPILAGVPEVYDELARLLP